MLSEPKLKLLQDLVRSSSKEELTWMSGYVAGAAAFLQQPAAQSQPYLQQEALLQAAANLQSSAAVQAAAGGQGAQLQAVAATAVATAPAIQKITIAYGTESGNSKRLATDFAAKAKKFGISARVVSLDQYRLNDLSKEEYFFTVISTQGEGEPPATAKKFYDHIHLNGFKLDKLKYGVLALGDTSYPLFCKAGEDVDNQLQKLGGERIVTLAKCDTDYQTDADSWFARVLQKLQSNEAPAPAAVAVVVAPTNGTMIAEPAKKTGKKIYTGTIIANINLNDRGSKKQTHHIEIAAEDVEYQPGDSIGVVAENPLAIVKAILNLTGTDGNKSITFRNEPYTTFDLLKKKLNITYLPERVVRNYSRIVNQEIPDTKISLYDLLKIYPVKDSAQFLEVIDIIEPITPRLYSISSSPNSQSGEVHVTVAKDIFMVNDERRCGLCSDYLLNMPENTSFEFYVHKNSQFRLPESDKDVIMIGPGTGVAPFRAFLSERDAVAATGRNWLFFGEQHFQSDFLYQTEIQNWVQTGVLSKVSLAFSRDQQYKIYVQHRILEQAPDLWKWIEGGAYIYICGAKEPMSKDVDYAMLQVIERFGNKSTTQAVEFLENLKEQGRYLKDVY